MSAQAADSTTQLAAMGSVVADVVAVVVVVGEVVGVVVTAVVAGPVEVAGPVVVAAIECKDRWVHNQMIRQGTSPQGNMRRASDASQKNVVRRVAHTGCLRERGRGACTSTSPQRQPLLLKFERDCGSSVVFDHT